MNRAISTQELEALGLKITAREPMSKHTTWGIGGPAEWYAEPASLEQLSGLLRFARANGLPVFFLGGGSNLLVGDRGLDGFVVRLRGVFEQVEFGASSVRAGAGVYLPTLIKQCAERGLGGAEPLVGVPGTVGGALVMNAGTRDLEIGRIVQSVEVLNESGGLDLVPSEKISFEYRKSTLGARAVCFATLRLEPGRREDFLAAIQKFISHRLQTQPIGTLNSGSVFRNPEGGFAAQLIERAGLKGHKRGNAQVSPKHANFIVNCGGATAEDVKGLILEIQKTVKEKCGVELEPEVKMVGC
jgi:UDP-N-acetylmuramate dehydrogenase